MNNELLKAFSGYADATRVSTTDNKLLQLEQQKQEKLNKLGANKDYANLDNSYTTLDTTGTVEINANKIWNEGTAGDIQYALGSAVNEQIYRRSDGSTFQRDADGNEINYDGDTRRAYMYGTKDDLDAVKFGLARGDLPSSDYRYEPGRAEKEGFKTGKNGYGWDAGADGVDLNKKLLDVELPYETATALEGLIHGRTDALANRKYPDYLSPEAMNHASGVSEYYKSIDGMLGDSRNEENLGGGLLEVGKQVPGVQSSHIDKNKLMLNALLGDESTVDSNPNSNWVDGLQAFAVREAAVPIAYARATAEGDLSSKNMKKQLEYVQTNADKMVGYDTTEMGLPEKLRRAVGTGTENVVNKITGLVGEGLQTIGEVQLNRDNKKDAYSKPLIDISGAIDTMSDSFGTWLKDTGSQIQKDTVEFTKENKGAKLTGFDTKDVNELSKEVSDTIEKEGYVSAFGKAVTDSRTLQVLAQSIPEMIALAMSTGGMALVNVNHNINVAEDNVGRELTTTEKVKSAVVSIASTYLDRAGDKLALSGMNPAKQALKSVVDSSPAVVKNALASKFGADILKIGEAPLRLVGAAAVEGVTEYGQTLGEEAAQNPGVFKDGFTEEQWKEADVAGVLGAASGSHMAAPRVAKDVLGGVGSVTKETIDIAKDKLKKEPKETAEVVKDIKTRADEVFADELVIDTTEVEQRIATANAVINNPEATPEDVELAKQSLVADQDVLSKSVDRLKVDKLADVLEIEADVLELSEKDPTKAEYLEKIKNAKKEVAKEIEDLEDPVEYGKRLGSKARFLDVLDDVVEVSDEAELSGKLADNLRQIAATFGVTDETFNQKIKKDFATVELEATKSSKGYMTQGKALRAILSATTPDAKKVNKLVTKMQNYQATQEKWLDRFDKAVSEVNSELKAYNDAPNKDLVPKPSEKPRKFDVSKNSKFDLKVKELDDGTFAISTMDQMNAIADAKRQNIAGIQNELSKSKELLEKAGIGQDTTGIQTDIIIDSETIPQKMKVSVDNAIKHFAKNKVNAFIGEEGAKGSRNSWILKDNKQLTNKNTYTKDDVVGILAPNIANDADLKAFEKSLADPKSVLRKQLDAAAKAGATIVVENDTRVKGKTDKSTNLRNKAKGLLVSQVVTYKGYQSIGDAEGKGLSRVLKPKEVASKERLDKIVQEKAKREVAKVKADALAKKLDEYVDGKEVALDGVEQYFTEVDKLKSYLENAEQKKIAEYIKLTKEKSKLEKLLNNMKTVAEGKDNEKRLAEVNKELAGLEKFADKAKDKITDTEQKKAAGKNLLDEYKKAKLVDELDPEGTAVEEFMATIDNDYVQESLSNSSSKGADNMYITYAEGKTPKVGNKETVDAIEHILDINKLVKQTNQPLLGAIEIEDMFDSIQIDGVEYEISAAEYMKDAKKLLNDTITQSTIKPEVAGKRTVLDWTLKDSPAYGLLFNKDGEINDTTVLAIKLAIDEYIAYNAKMLSATYKSREDVAQMVGIIEPALGDNQYELLKDVGVFKKTMSNEIGRGILTKLGLGKIKEVETESYNKLLAELGHMGVMVGINTGLLEETTLTVEKYGKAIDADTGAKTKFDPNKYAVETDAKGTITFVREVLDKDGKKQIEEMVANTAVYEAVHELLDDTSAFRKEPSKTPIKNRRHEREQVAKDITGNKIPTGGKDKGFTSSKEAINNLIDTKWKVNTKLIQKIKDMSKEQQDVLKDWMGFKTEAQMDLMAYDARLAQESVNRDIDKSIVELVKLVDENASDELYFDWFYSSNGRYMLDSNTVNPQTDKQLHRWLITPAKQSLDYVRKDDKFAVDGKDMTDMVKYAVAQAFGYDVDKQKTTDIMEFADKLLGLNEQQITELETAVFTNGEEYKIGDTKIEPEHIGHMMQGIDFLKEAKKDKFTSNLSAEFDAVTSGFGLKLLQIPILGSGLETMWKWLNKVGVFKSNQLNGFNSMNDILKSDNFYGDGKKFFDSYQTLASEADVTSAIFGDKHNVSKAIFKSVASVLPKLDANGEVSKALRTLFKDPFMTFNYSAGIASIKRSLSNNMLANMINEIVAEKPKAEYVEVTQSLAKQFNTTPAKLIDELRNTPLSKIKFGKDGFEKTMFDMFYNSYGTKVEQIMTDNFGEFMAAHKDINAAFKAMFEVFNVMYKAKVAEVKKGQLTDEKKLEIIDELRQYFPVIKGPLSEGIEDGISIYKTGSVTSSVEDQRQTPAQTYIKDKDGKVKSSMIRYRIKEFEAAISAGSVVPIHYIDGSLMAQLLGKDAGITAIHDAIIPPLNMAKELIQKYNENMIKIAKTYSVVGAINDMLNRVDTTEITSMDQKINVEDLVKSAETGKRAYKDVSIKSYFNEMKTRITELNAKVEAGREELFKDMEDNGVAVGHMAAVPGSMYNSKGEVEAKQEDVKMSVLDKIQQRIGMLFPVSEDVEKELESMTDEQIEILIDNINNCK